MGVASSGQATGGQQTAAPMAYAPVSPPLANGTAAPVPNPALQGLDASAIQVSGGNPFALGGRGYGNYAPPDATQAPAQAPMSVQAPMAPRMGIMRQAGAPNGGFPPTPATPIPAPSSPAVMQGSRPGPRYSRFM